MDENEFNQKLNAIDLKIKELEKTKKILETRKTVKKHIRCSQDLYCLENNKAILIEEYFGEEFRED